MVLLFARQQRGNIVIGEGSADARHLRHAPLLPGARAVLHVRGDWLSARRHARPLEALSAHVLEDDIRNKFTRWMTRSLKR